MINRGQVLDKTVQSNVPRFCTVAISFKYCFRHGGAHMTHLYIMSCFHAPSVKGMIIGRVGLPGGVGGVPLPHHLNAETFYSISLLTFRPNAVPILRLRLDKPSQHEAFTQCCFNVGTPSSTLAQH